jgi:hypothetical protein
MSLETLAANFLRVMPEAEFQVATVLSNVVSRALTDNPGTLIGRDTQHYAWRFERDAASGDKWLVFGLVPFQYLPTNYGKLYPDVPVDDLVRKAISGSGGMFIKKTIVEIA